MTTGTPGGAWILPPDTSKNFAIDLFCFPPAGSGAATYRLWQAALGPDIGVHRVQPPGRETRFREPLIRDFDTYVDRLLAELRPHIDGPFAFFGHSMGSIIAFRVAQRLWDEFGRAPAHLFVSAFRSPQAPPIRRLFELPDREFVRALRDTYDGIPDQLLNEPEVLELMLPIVRADLEVVAGHDYRPERPFDCPITALGGVDDRWVDEAQLSEWSVQTTAKFDLKMLPGNHYYLNTAGDALYRAIMEPLGLRLARDTS